MTKERKMADKKPNLSSSPFNLKRYLIGTKKIERWIMVGSRQEYLLTETSCNCRHFMVQAIRDSTQLCKHLKILKEAQKTKSYDEIIIGNQAWKTIRPFLFQKTK